MDEGDAWLRDRWSLADASATADLHRLHLAQAEFDLAPITTLHGLCRRILADFPFETGEDAFDPDEQVASDEIDRELRDDLWRRLAQSADDHDEGDRAWFKAGRKAPGRGALRAGAAAGRGGRVIDPAALDDVDAIRSQRAGDPRLHRRWQSHSSEQYAALKTQLEVLSRLHRSGRSLRRSSEEDEGRLSRESTGETVQADRRWKPRATIR